MYPIIPEKITSFQVVAGHAYEYYNEAGAKMQSVTKEHVIALDSEGRLWARFLDNTEWALLNAPRAL